MPSISCSFMFPSRNCIAASLQASQNSAMRAQDQRCATSGGCGRAARRAPDKIMMMKPSMENASSPHDEMAVPKAMMDTAIVTCGASQRRTACAAPTATHRRGQLVQAHGHQDDHGHHRRRGLEDLDERHREVQVREVSKAQRRRLRAVPRQHADDGLPGRLGAQAGAGASARAMRKPSGKMR